VYNSYAKEHEGNASTGLLCAWSAYPASKRPAPCYQVGKSFKMIWCLETGRQSGSSWYQQL